MSKTFKQLVAEAKAKHAVLTFGRFQPPTIGHEKLVGVLADTAKRKGGTPFLFPSRTNDKKKNPLTPKAKVKFLKSVFPQVTIVDDAGSMAPGYLPGIDGASPDLRQARMRDNGLT